ncbi:MAG: NAD(P)-dependent alcohol dehydrogenase [Terriglobales bacterium]
MSVAQAYATPAARAPLAPFTVERRALRPRDVAIEILYCGICHTDLHQVRDEWHNGIFPMVPGHEITGRVSAVGGEVTEFQVGELAGVGCMVDSCRRCANCQAGLEQFCDQGAIMTYNGRDRAGEVTYGGYSNHIVVDADFVLHIHHPASQLAAVAPLLCAGITTYSPLRHWSVGLDQRVGVVGLGGLGHMAVKLAHAMGAEVVLFTRSSQKAEDARRLGASEVVLTGDEAAMQAQHGRLDFILDTVAAFHDVNPLLNALKRDGTLTLVGVPDQPLQVAGFPLIMARRALAGSLIGGIAETQEMLDFCAAHEIVSDVEVIPIQKINEAYDRLARSDVKYRFSIDMGTLQGG